MSAALECLSAFSCPLFGRIRFPHALVTPFIVFLVGLIAALLIFESCPPPDWLIFICAPHRGMLTRSYKFAPSASLSLPLARASQHIFRVGGKFIARWKSRFFDNADVSMTVKQYFTQKRIVKYNVGNKTNAKHGVNFKSCKQLKHAGTYAIISLR